MLCNFCTQVLQYVLPVVPPSGLCCSVACVAGPGGGCLFCGGGFPSSCSTMTTYPGGHPVPSCVVLCNPMLCRAIPCCVLCCAMLFRVMLVVLCVCTARPTSTCHGPPSKTGCLMGTST